MIRTLSHVCCERFLRARASKVIYGVFRIVSFIGGCRAFVSLCTIFKCFVPLLACDTTREEGMLQRNIFNFALTKSRSQQCACFTEFVWERSRSFVISRNNTDVYSSDDSGGHVLFSTSPHVAPPMLCGRKVSVWDRVLPAFT